MSFGELGVIALALYLLILATVAEVARRSRRDESPSDHFLAGRDLGVFVLFLTLYATAYSGNSLLGYPGRAYEAGFSFVMSTGFMMAVIVAFHMIAPKLRQHADAEGFVTPGDWVRHRFGGEGAGRALSIAIGILMVVALANFLLAQLQAMGTITGRVTDGLVPHAAGVIGLALMILFYESLGGMRAVAWTDSGQGLLMLFGLAGLLTWLMSDAGGLGNITARVMEVRPEAIAVPDAQTCANWFSTIALLGFGSVLYPQAIQRIFAARSPRVLQRSFALMTFMPLTTTLVVTLIGIAAIARIDPSLGVASDEVMPWLLAEWAAGGGLRMFAAILVFLGALAAIMSTADSCLLSLGSLAAGDILGRPRGDAATTRLGKWIAAAILFVMVPFAIQGELTLWRLIELKMELLIQCVPAFLVALHWRGLRAAPTLAGLVLGTTVAAAGTLLGWKTVLGIHVGMIGLVLNLMVAVGFSLWSARRGSASS
ncbi:MAG: sodium:solute symporter family protein [Deltaproteobacteria bacterium]